MNGLFYEDDKDPWYVNLWWHFKCKWVSCIETPYYSAKLFLSNVWRFRIELRTYHNWCSNSSLSLFAAGLENLAQALKQDNWHVNSQKYYRQASEVAEILRRCSIEQEHPIYEKLHDQYSAKHWSYLKRVKHKDGAQSWTFPGAPEYLTKRSSKYTMLNAEYQKDQLSYALDLFKRRYQRWWC